MRKKSKKQMPLMPAATDHPQAIELESISYILGINSTICDLVMQDLSDVINPANNYSQERLWFIRLKRTSLREGRKF